MVKNQTTLSNFQNYFFEMNNEKKRIISPTISNFQLSASAVIQTSVVPLSLSPPRLGPLLYQDILRERAKFDNRNNFYLCFLHIFAKELQLKIYFCIQLQNNCVLTKILHKIFKMFVILYNQIAFKKYFFAYFCKRIAIETIFLYANAK